MQLGTVDQWVSKISAAAAGAHTRNLPLLIVSHHSCMVLPCGDPLDSETKKGLDTIPVGRLLVLVSGLIENVPAKAWYGRFNISL